MGDSETSLFYDRGCTINGGVGAGLCSARACLIAYEVFRFVESCTSKLYKPKEI